MWGDINAHSQPHLLQKLEPVSPIPGEYCNHCDTSKSFIACIEYPL